ncbi:hypothetical protein Vafri_6562 [Volvox africanus]|uniref:Uncharacterized protein n=1 Tax=Volvox africanus TaxID=51714 RepID=A0A8J4B0K9_9CHLO|nr:hypothetical protein Vafri_6562 [Volvox africanus]
MFGEAQVLVGMARMAAGEAIAEVVAPDGAAAAADVAAAAVVADAVAGDTSSDRTVPVSDSSLVLEVLAAQARQVAANHCDHIAQVLQDLRNVPGSLGTLSEMPPIVAPAADAAADLLRRTASGGGAAAAAAAAADLAAYNQAAGGGLSRRHPRASGPPNDDRSGVVGRF